MSDLRQAAPPQVADFQTTYATDRNWQHLMRTANTAYQCGDQVAALGYYRNALQEAERLIACAERCNGPEAAAMILVISHHNIAQLAAESGHWDLVRQHYQEPFDRLLALASLPTTPNQLRQACVENLKQATIALATHLQTSGAPGEAVARVINRARCVVSAPSDRSERPAPARPRFS
ncbi:DUF2753 family protein [Pontibaca salina]|uniref:DUF2753 family protein n=1 Tax=Pontibaca salina TaxID=2795731 RepID=A0A934HSV5_9RHOB|nr:DUF2753 family protein [Pontibaca salina]MBI6630095.1 DUF2753 family protein [Pontibaca salina]